MGLSARKLGRVIEVLGSGLPVLLYTGISGVDGVWYSERSGGV
jgi:hypothetical protein